MPPPLAGALFERRLHNNPHEMLLYRPRGDRVAFPFVLKLGIYNEQTLEIREQLRNRADLLVDALQAPRHSPQTCTVLIWFLSGGQPEATPRVVSRSRR